DQRADADAGALGIGVANDDELLALNALHLEPAPAAAGDVGGRSELRDDPLELHPARVAQERRPGAGMVVAVLDARGRADKQRRQRWLARIEAGGPQVVAVEVEQVEAIVDQAAGRAGRERRSWAFGL